jgi:hypothetical protein
VRLLETAAVASGCFAGGCLAVVPLHPTLWASVAFGVLAVVAAIADTLVQAIHPPVARLEEQMRALEQTVREIIAVQNALQEISHKRSADVATLEQQVDRLNKANAFKGL